MSWEKRPAFSLALRRHPHRRPDPDCFPSQFFEPMESQTLNIILYLLPWGGFLILSALTVNYLYEEKQKQLQDLKTAYIGVLEILSKLMESVDRYTEGHSVRVSTLAAGHRQ
ncbi:MAG: hypothetical protein MZU84_05730 [Sphingobacterium sp.]|nr:hypothetical protein [Sphingobacterium sp.]